MNNDPIFKFQIKKYRNNNEISFINAPFHRIYMFLAYIKYN